MVRQYIGARYVPKFYDNPNGTAEWLPNVIYEPLTIVTYDSNSYTSKKTVPASVGIPANNPEYWVATGNYNGFIGELSERIDNVESELNDKIDNVEEELNESITTNTNNITALENEVDVLQLNTRVFAFIGDSFNSAVNPWTFNAELSRRLDAPVYNYSHDGAGFLGTSPDYTFLNQLQSALSEHSDLTDIIIYGGNNDYGRNDSDFITAVDAFFAYCTTHLNDIRLHIFVVNRPDGTYNRNEYLKNSIIGDSTGNKVKARIYDNVNALQICNFGYFSNTNSHPSETFSKYVLAPFMCKCINGGGDDFEASLGYTLSSNIELVKGELNLIGDGSQIGFNEVIIKYTGSSTPSTLEVCTYNNLVRQPSSRFVLHGLAASGSNYYLTELDLYNDHSVLKVYGASSITPNTNLIIFGMSIKI